MKKAIPWLIFALIATMACGLSAPATQPSQTNLETAVAETVQALTATAPLSAVTEIPATEADGQLTPDGTPLQTAEISFLIPNSVANDATSSMTTEVEYPYVNPSLGDMPQHLSIKFNLYAVSNSVYTPRIMIFRADEYSQYSEMTASTVKVLQTTQYIDGQPLPDELDTNFTVQIHALDFQNGHGVRYLTQVMQNFGPITNDALFYYYQGVTSDNKYFVQAILPINAAFLPADGNIDTPVPADGVPFNMDDFPGYLDAVAQKLNSTETYNFNPFLDALDEMIASMQVTGF
ncbi:MAG: hypothetical protein IPP55_19700 [Anaerolineales bacterium]|nr:hypothetical protein [Anaerolineales bacterium]